MTKSKFAKLSLVSTVSLLAVAGCSTSVVDREKTLSRSDAMDRLDHNQGQIAANTPALTNAKATNRPSNINVREGLFLGDVGYQASNGNPLPSRFETEDGITLHFPAHIGIEQFSQALEKVTGIRVEYGDITMNPTLGQGSVDNGAGQASEGQGIGDADGEGGSAGMDDSAGSGGDAGKENPREFAAFVHPTEVKFAVNHHGKLSDLLDHVAARMNVDWAYEGGRIQFLGAQTVAYTIWSLPGKTTSEASIGGASDGLFGGGSPAKVTSTMELDYWETFDSGLAALMPMGGATYSVNRSSGTIVVTAPQNLQRRVQAFVERENRRLSRQVAVKLDVISFASDRKDEKGTSLSGLLDQSSRGFNIDLLSASNGVENGLNLDTGIVSGPLSGIGNVISVLSQKGKVSHVTSQTMIAMNNTPTPLSITDERAYLAGVTVTEEEGVTSTELETGTIQSGINAVVTPRIMSSGMVTLQYALNFTELVSLEEFKTDDGSASSQLPNILNQNFMQTVNIRSGDSIVIGSFDKKSTQDKSSGPFAPEFWGLGGSSEYSMKDQKILVIMTPVVLEDQNRPLRR